MMGVDDQTGALAGPSIAAPASVQQIPDPKLAGEAEKSAGNRRCLGEGSEVRVSDPGCQPLRHAGFMAVGPAGNLGISPDGGIGYNTNSRTPITSPAKSTG